MTPFPLSTINRLRPHFSTTLLLLSLSTLSYQLTPLTANARLWVSDAIFTHVTFGLRSLFWLSTLVSRRRPHALVMYHTCLLMGEVGTLSSVQTNKLHRASFLLVTTEEGVYFSLTSHLACLSLPVWLKMVRDWDHLYLKPHPKSL